MQVVAISDLGLGTQENAGALKGSGGITTALTLADGILVDLSVVGALHCCIDHCPHRARLSMSCISGDNHAWALSNTI